MDGEGNFVGEIEMAAEELAGERARWFQRVEFGGTGQRLDARRPRVTSAWSRPHLGTDQ